MQSMKIQYEQELANLTASHEELVARLERKEKELSAAIEDNKVSVGYFFAYWSNLSRSYLTTPEI